MSKIFNDLLDIIYSTTSNNYQSDETDKSTTYGEITFSGMEKIASYTESFHKKNPINPINYQFIDLGCGLGKFVIYMALYRLYKSNGIELVKKRYEEAVFAKSTLKNKNFDNYGNINFINRSFLDPQYLPIIRHCGVVFISNLCFEDETQQKLYEILKNF